MIPTCENENFWLSKRQSEPGVFSGTARAYSRACRLTLACASWRSQKQEIERIGNRWATLFARGRDDCYQTTQPLCERIACERVGHGQVKIRNCTPPTSVFRRSFEAAIVFDVAIKGARAAARFSNGEVVELHGDRGTWWIRKLGANAGRGFFE